jgi:hypothetical protein
MRRPAPSLVALSALLASAVSCAPANFPDTPTVAAAQATYCQALGKMSGAGDKWDRLGDCKSATITGSAGYLKGMARCLPTKKEASPDKDMGLLVGECRDEVFYKLTVDETNAQSGMEARCDRAARCEKTAVPECMAQAKKADSTQRATFYGQYNGAALYKISDCLRSSACGSDEYAAQNACYKQAEEKLLFLP